MDHINLVGWINSLIEVCKDGEYGFRACAEHAHRIELRSLFSERSEQCGDAAAELQGLVVEQLSGRPETQGSAGGALHRGWVAVKGSLAGYTDLSLLEECVRAEGVAREHYIAVMERDLPRVVIDVLVRHLEGIKRNHAEMRMLYDEERLARV